MAPAEPPLRPDQFDRYRRHLSLPEIGLEGQQRLLSGSVLLVVGAEAEGVPREVLDRCDEVVRIPMGGFIASYNLQTAVAAIAAERFRQLERDIR